ncbi:MAG: serine/threonine-protein kinase [Burkholderiales bacterium]
MTTTNDALPKLPGTLGRYQIAGEIARGAMGVIYKARDPLIDRVVAIKTIALSFTPSEIEAFERRFFREAKSAGRLNHPNIVTIYDVGKAGDVAYIAMEYLDGRSLREVLDSGVVLPHDKVADIAAQVADGLAYAHSQQVVHRDVKPANIMVLHTGRVKITDFGIALLPTGTRTLTANVFGSPRYTSPEQVMGRTVDGRSDIFSLGAVLYEMLTGLPPFAADDLNGILKQVLSEPTPPPSTHNPTIPAAFDHIVGKALAKDPADRYQDAAQMAADLRNYASLEFDSPGLSPLPPLEHPTVDLRAPALPASMPAAIADRQAMADATQRRARLRLGLGIGAGAVLVALAFAIGYRSLPDAPTADPKVAASAADPGRGAATSDGRAEGGARGAAEPVVAAAGGTGTAATGPGTPATPVTKEAVAPSASQASAGTVAAADRPPAAAAMKAETAAPVAAPAGAHGTASGATPPATPDAAAKPAAPAKPPGRILLAVTPWGEVLVDGRKRGLAPPLSELRVPPGKHTVEVRNSTFPPYTETVDVPPGGDVRIRHKFQ